MSLGLQRDEVSGYTSAWASVEIDRDNESHIPLPQKNVLVKSLFGFHRDDAGQPLTTILATLSRRRFRAEASLALRTADFCLGWGDEGRERSVSCSLHVLSHEVGMGNLKKDDRQATANDRQESEHLFV